MILTISINLMLKIIRIYFFVCFTLLTGTFATGQNYFVSNLYNNIVFSNPSIPSFNNYSHLQLNYRNQWPVAGMYTTYGASFFHNAKSLNSNFGIILNHDRQLNSAFTSTSIGANYSYSLKTGYRTKLLFGLNGNYVFENLNYNRLNFENPVSWPSERNNIPVINSGISFVLGNNHLLGFSVINILGNRSSNLTSQEYNVCYIGEIEVRRRGNTPLLVEPLGEVSFKNNFLDISYGVNFGFSALKTGILLSQSNLKVNTATFLLGILYYNYEFIYTYDLNLSGAVSINPKMAAHEVTFLSKFQYKVKRKKHGAIKCPKL